MALFFLDINIKCCIWHQEGWKKYLLSFFISNLGKHFYFHETIQKETDDRMIYRYIRYGKLML